ncbi:MAG: efflux RND transporter periplasmic adaptor subunit [Bryobacteraceae bacterium]
MPLTNQAEPSRPSMLRTMMQRKSVLIAAVAVCVIAGLGTWAVLNSQTGVQYRTSQVEQGDLNITISATGNPNAVVTVQVGSQVSGIVMALYADFNTKVTKGQLIARIDPASFQARVDQAQANLDGSRAATANSEAEVQKAQAGIQASLASLSAAKANVIKAQVTAEDDKAKAGRRVQLALEGVISKEDLDTAQATYKTSLADQDAIVAQQRASEDNVKVAQAELKVARTQLTASQAQAKQFMAALRLAQIDLDYTYIKAPADGIVVARRVDVGQTVAASLAAPTLFEIAQDLTKMQVDTNVSEADVGRVRVGQPATFTVDAYPKQIFRGTVTSIRKAPINVQNVITYDAVVGVANPDLKLFPGMTANVKILVNQRPGVLKIVNGALRYHPASEKLPAASVSKGGRRSAPEQAAWLLQDNNKAQRVVVTTGETDGSYTEITGGNLKEGDRVILAALTKTATASSAPAAQNTSKSGRGPGF